MHFYIFDDEVEVKKIKSKGVVIKICACTYDGWLFFAFPVTTMQIP